jgi:TonB family protein
MSDRNKNRENRLQDFLRYQKGDMTGEEKNSFEKGLQKDPFAEEAAEGLASITAEQVSEDIEHLRKRIGRNRTHGRRFTFYRIAASVAVLMVISTLFIFIERNRSVKQPGESAVQIKPFEIIKQGPVRQSVAENTKPEAAGKITEKKEVRPEAGNETSVTSRIAIVSGGGVIAGKEIKAKADSQLLVSIDTSISALDEVVVTGYGIRKYESGDKDLKPGHISPQPLNGKAAFDKYIQENIHRPDSATAGQRVVVVLNFLVHTDGRIDSIRIVRSPGKMFSDEAIRLIKSGPAWKPAEENREKIDDEVRVRIVFK